MGVFVSGVRLGLALVFAVAGGAKLAGQSEFRQTVGQFGVPPSLVGRVALGLPLVELAVAVLLVPGPTAPWAAVAALGLLALFVTAIGGSLARGRRPPCRCFGQLRATPLGRGTLVRNALLAVAAGLVVWHG